MVQTSRPHFTNVLQMTLMKTINATLELIFRNLFDKRRTGTETEISTTELIVTLMNLEMPFLPDKTCVIKNSCRRLHLPKLVKGFFKPGNAQKTCGLKTKHEANFERGCQVIDSFFTAITNVIKFRSQFFPRSRNLSTPIWH